MQDPRYREVSIVRGSKRWTETQRRPVPAGRTATVTFGRSANFMSQLQGLMSKYAALKVEVDALNAYGNDVHYKDRKHLIQFRGYYNMMGRYLREVEALSPGGSVDLEQYSRRIYYLNLHAYYAAQVVCRWIAAGRPDMSKNERRPLGDKAITEETETGAFGQTSGRSPITAADNPAVGAAALGAGVVIVGLLAR